MTVVSSVGLAGLAGCSGGDTPADAAEPTVTETATATPTATGTESPAGGTDGQVDLPPGTSASGIAEPGQLIQTTQAALRQNGYDITTTLTSGDPDRTITQHFRSSLESKRHSFVFDAPDGTARVFVGNGTIYQQSGGSDTSTRPLDQQFDEYHRSRDIVRMLGGQETLGGILDAGEFQPSGTGEHRGRPVVEFALAGVTLGSDDTEITSSSGSLVIGADGVVFEARLRVEYATAEDDRVYENTFVIDELGTVSVSEPSWVQE
ncbi:MULTISPECIES: hypothetical protein [Salinibaculum]|uniref:hypothetical protein n=1 Tax=Salinibaculum TaxID=2732368 RepID=UPI0030CBAA48